MGLMGNLACASGRQAVTCIERVAALVVYLCSDAAQAIAGTAILIDRGSTAR